MTLAATLYTRPGCRLCEDALADLERLRARYPHTLRQVDVQAQPELTERFGERVPVLAIGEREYAAPLPRAVLERALRDAQQVGAQARGAGESAQAAADDRPLSASAKPRHRDRPSFGDAMRHWLRALNLSIGLFLAGAVAAPVLAALGWRAAADTLYAAYHLTCHQWAFRSFFLFGPHATYSPADLLAQGVDPYIFVGSPAVGWKMAFCERDLAIYLGVLVVSLAYARKRNLPALGFVPYAVLILPIALDGFTQLVGWRESTWELRVSTGIVFGLASAALVLPRLDAAISPRRAAADDYPHGTSPCEPLSPLLPHSG